MAKREEQTALKSDAGVKPGSDKIISRRGFVSVVARAAIPTIAVIGMGRLARAADKPRMESQELKKASSKGPNDCVLTCEGGCRGCEGECLGTCKDACFLTCEGSCKYNCTGGCNTTCEGGCKNSCGGQCSSGAW